MQVKTEVSDATISIEKTDQINCQVSDSIFVVQFQVLKGEIQNKMIIPKTLREMRQAGLLLRV